jgi:trehalose 6-phosphate synthase
MTERPGSVRTTHGGLLESRHLILASNRGPFQFSVTDEGYERKRGAGGVVTAVSAVSQLASPTWVAAAMTPGDRRVAAERPGEAIEVEERDSRFSLRFVDLPEEMYDGYYNVIANPLLWFIQHYMWDTPREPTIGAAEWRAWREGYGPANEEFARVIGEEIRRSARPPVVMLQDYHLYLVPGALRREHPDVPVQLFLHIPFPGSDYLRILPWQMRREIVASLLCCDIVGFQTHRSAVNFLRSAASFLPGVRVNFEEMWAEYDGRRTLARWYPISIDPETVRGLAMSEEGERELAFLGQYFAELNILRVDRIEPSKNILRGFEAYSLLLDEHPELKERVRFLACLVPSRNDLDQYARYQDEVMAAVGRINIKHGAEYWRPVEVFLGDNYIRALAAMRRYDVLLVNPVIDGMNLVAKEGVVVNERDGVLVLSDGAGAFEQFAPLPHSVSATDVLGTAEALYAALHMAAEERRELATRLRGCVEQEDVAYWLDSQLGDLQDLCEARGLVH